MLQSSSAAEHLGSNTWKSVLVIPSVIDFDEKGSKQD